MFSPKTIFPKSVLGTTGNNQFPLTVTLRQGIITGRRPVITFEFKSEGQQPWKDTDIFVLDMSSRMYPILNGNETPEKRHWEYQYRF